MLKNFSILFLTFFVSISVFSQDFDLINNLDNKIPVDPKIKVGRLDNGMTYYIRKNAKPEKRAELRLVVKAGSVLEDEDQLGLAHFMEHMEFNGTKNFAKNEIVSYLQSIGVKFGADLNAYTSFDETVYILPIPTDDEKILKQTFQILEDWAHNATLDHGEIDKERGVVIEEWRIGRGAAQRMRDKTFPVLLKDSRYAERLPIGTLESLQNFEYESLRRFYNDWYRPDLMAVVAVGDFDPAQIEELIKAHFSGIQNPVNEREREQFHIPDHEQTLVAIASDKEATFSTVSLYIKNDLEKEETFKDYYNNLLHIFYTGMLNQRLQEIAQKPAPPFIYAGTSYGRLLGDKSSFTAMANVREGDLLKGLRSLLTEVERVKKYGFTSSELERFKKDFLSFYEQAYNERDKSESRSFANEYIRNFLHNEPIPGIEMEFAIAKKYIPEIKKEEINVLSAKFFRPDNRVIIVNSPEKEGITLLTETDILNVVEEVTKTHVSPYVDALSGSSLMEKLPEPGKVTDEKKYEKINVTELTLSNGAKVILKPTDFKNDEILMTAWSEGGSSLYSDKDYMSASNADAVVNECGVGNFSPTDLQKLLAGKTASVRPFIGTLSEGVNGSCVPKDMETMFQLLHLTFTSPNKSKDLFQSYIDKNKALYKNLLSNPNYYFYNESIRVMTQNHPRGGMMPTEEDWDKIDFDRTFEIYKERFANAGDFTFVFVGNFKVDSIKKYLEQYVASLPATGGKEHWRDLGIRPPQGIVQHDVYKGTDPKSMVAVKFHGKYKFDRKTNYHMKSLTDALNIILIEKIREEQSGVYGINASPSTYKAPYEHYLINISFPCKPENSGVLTDSVFQILHKIHKEGVTDEIFEKVKEGQIRDMEVKIKKNGYWMGALQYSYKYGYDPEDIPEYRERIDALTKDDIKSAAEKFLNFNNYVYLRLLPEEGP